MNIIKMAYQHGRCQMIKKDKVCDLLFSDQLIFTNDNVEVMLHGYEHHYQPRLCHL